ncbi:MAG: magnesium/cobalt efflux protein [Gammaproteobacteria bacterium CG_4_10_14_0_8_um_filter_38_16]|nr:MAG: magnesium/cobalt efflux protein [Gammaproteobacteria bacterium CG_4_10_14_0_8_um_filter_38_16]PJA03440.1 MAG: magnesium/cobalt efflux protein [Gammaproteobacteria bacterium CG_4_10_14_0_2_um_filter_38_22]PJB10595.1 MAG: magnesium/cobalt efflux protein [Gammaproteobacteria bacterium CG_4_9_14_3_um_filter_38_9]
MSNKKNNFLKRITRFLSSKPRNQKELIALLHDAQQRVLINRDTLQMFEGVLAVSGKKVRDVMVPRAQMVTISSDTTLTEMLPNIAQSQHSRFPVTGENDKVLGVLLAKDLLRLTIEPKLNNHSIFDLIREVIFVPENKPLDVLLKEFRLKRNHMAIVVNEYGSIVGLVTIEDVLEEIVGEIEDEYDIDNKEPVIKEIEENIYLVSALTPLDTFNRHFGTHFNDDDIETIGGLIVRHFGHLPRRNEKTLFHDFDVQVVKATRRGVQWLQFKKNTAS